MVHDRRIVLAFEPNDLMSEASAPQSARCGAQAGQGAWFRAVRTPAA